MSLTENKRNTFRKLSRLYTRQPDIFLLNIPRCQKMDIGKYKILKSIKDGLVMTLRSNICKKLVFKKPNVVMVFSTKAPDMSKLSKDSWLILKISDDHEKLENVTK